MELKIQYKNGRYEAKKIVKGKTITGYGKTLQEAADNVMLKENQENKK